jgi:TPR repeat protein
MKLFLSFIFLSISIVSAYGNYFSKAMEEFYNGNYSKSITLYKKACKNKKAGACYNLGVYYFEGRVVDLNYTFSKNYFHKACKYGIDLGCKKYKYLQKKGY